MYRFKNPTLYISTSINKNMVVYTINRGIKYKYYCLELGLLPHTIEGKCYIDIDNLLICTSFLYYQIIR